MATCFAQAQLKLTVDLIVPARLRRAAMEMRLHAQAQRFQALALSGDGRSMGELAAEVGPTSSYFTRILRLSFLVPEITKAILDRRQPPGLSAASWLGCTICRPTGRDSGKCSEL